MFVFTCEDNIEAKLTCIYVAWEYATKVGHSNVALYVEPLKEYELFKEYVHVDADSEKSLKVSRSIQKKISIDAYIGVYYALLSDEENALDDAYRFLIYAFKLGRNATYAITNPASMRIMELRRRVGNEIHSFVEFIRFNQVDGNVYISHIEPKADVTLLVGNHFEDRMPSEHWIIIDDKRKKALVHPKDGESFVKLLSDDEFNRLSGSETYNDEYTVMWKTFFDSIAIKERENRKCQMNHFPVWMRKHAVEFSV